MVYENSYAFIYSAYFKVSSKCRVKKWKILLMRVFRPACARNSGQWKQPYSLIKVKFTKLLILQLPTGVFINVTVS